jgi:hypothetical protein
MSEKQRDAIIGDLMTKAGEDVTASIRRTLAICPTPHLPIVLAAAAAAIGTVTAILDEMAGNDHSRGPDPENILLAGLLAARTGMKGFNGPEDGVGAAYRDFETLKKAGRTAALSNERHPSV